MTPSAALSDTLRRKAVPREAIRALSVIPGIGPSLAADLYLLGIRKVESLKGAIRKPCIESFRDKSAGQLTVACFTHSAARSISRPRKNTIPKS